MDINGAKALKERLGANGAADALQPRVDLDLPEGAPPVYQWLGVGKSAPDGPPPAAEGAHRPETSLFRRLGLSVR